MRIFVYRKLYRCVYANSFFSPQDLSYKDKHWHEACFLCNKCRVSLVDKQFGSKVEKIYCGNCYDTQFAARCDGCGDIFRAGNYAYIILCSWACFCGRKDAFVVKVRIGRVRYTCITIITRLKLWCYTSCSASLRRSLQGVFGNRNFRESDCSCPPIDHDFFYNYFTIRSLSGRERRPQNNKVVLQGRELNDFQE